MNTNSTNPVTATIADNFRIDKPDARAVNIEVDYVGFTIPDVFVVGYGLDYLERYRNLPFIAELTPEIKKTINS